MLDKNVKANLISELVYDTWTVAWKDLELNQKPYEFFKRDAELLTAVVFNGSNMTSLISTTGVSTIKIRFGLDVKKASFKIILFGTDSTGQILTPYYVPERKVYSDLASEEEGLVPTELINQWKQNWLDKGGEGITNKNFMTPYGFTRGYNYSLQEFIQTLFKFKKAPNIFVHFVLHEYYSPNYLVTKETISTFGVVIQGRGATPELEDEKTDGYYDLTAPCPRTC
jgi:hypothetical protein